MSPGNQVAIVVIDNGVVVQHPPLVSNVVGIDGDKPTPQRNVAAHKGTFDELCEYLKSLELFQDEA